MENVPKEDSSTHQKSNHKPNQKMVFFNSKLENIQIYEQISMGGLSTIHRGEYQGLEVAVKKVFNPNVNE
jgi:hypothetical protein